MLCAADRVQRGDDLAFEFAAQPINFGRAPLARRRLLALLGLQPLPLQGVRLEHLDRPRHGADLVAAPQARHLGLVVAVGQRTHRAG
jgi:hypothetical protein